MNIPVTNMVRMACTTQKKVCGGETKTLIPLTKNLTVRIAIGVVVMDGYMAALVRVLDEIPTDEKHRADYINDFLTMSKAIKNCQRTDGFGM